MRPVQWLKAVGLFGLGAFYLGLTYVGTHPRVSQEYRDHYLERRYDCWLSDAQAAIGPELPRSIALGGMPYHESCVFLRAGWLRPTPALVWSQPGGAVLRLPWRRDAGAVRLDLRAAAATEPLGVTLALGLVTTSARIDPGAPGAVTLTLPPSPDHRGWEVQVRTEGVGTIANDGGLVANRPVGIGLERITYLDAP